LGESDAELREALRDLREVGRVTILTLGQYLRPTPQHLEVQRYIPPQEFEAWGKFAEDLGFEYVASGPMVRSSYHADEAARRFAPTLPKAGESPLPELSLKAP
ncbi:MAG: lipoyl synthase, partial [Deltaproteobacteria bacterium]|nr:lipoyl synthase [Deltaproteobacteria bacterium]